jgi:hypothetical protein
MLIKGVPQWVRVTILFESIAADKIKESNDEDIRKVEELEDGLSVYEIRE